MSRTERRGRRVLAALAVAIGVVPVRLQASLDAGTTPLVELRLAAAQFLLAYVALFWLRLVYDRLTARDDTGERRTSPPDPLSHRRGGTAAPGVR
jgi:hypothetical protein